MKHPILRPAGPLITILVLAACGTTASSAPGASPSSISAQASTGAAASPSPAPNPSADVAAPCVTAKKPFDSKKVDLTGAWAGDDDGIYYLRQLGTVVWWNGMANRAGPASGLGRDWNNVGRGELKDLKIEVDWADVPRGEILGSGTLSLTVKGDASGNVQIVKDSETGTGFGNSLWTPCTPG